MELYDFKIFFMWCSIINLVIALVGYVVIIMASDQVFRIHTRWFPMSRESFNRAIYSLFGQYKLLIFVFNVIPFIALAIMA